MLFIAMSAFSPFTIEAANLHAIIVADTTDESIGDSTTVDCSNMRAEMKKIAHFTKLDLKETTIEGEDVVPGKVLDKLDNLDIQSDDVVIFYFSGHGYRTDGKKDSPWPNLFFSRVEKGIDFELIGKRLEQHDPRLLLVIADVCNSIIAEEYAPALVTRSLLESIFAEESNPLKLFFLLTGVIPICPLHTPLWISTSL
jgi:hypothetical protein